MYYITFVPCDSHRHRFEKQMCLLFKRKTREKKITQIVDFTRVAFMAALFGCWLLTGADLLAHPSESSRFGKTKHTQTSETTTPKKYIQHNVH